ncbi:MAG TPA: outer membrane protein assembly factor BamB [Povalibacter sp.]|uniref:outer membrane protein assembly factor BamB n=1 Tax=Povalibacter sp. TaxID=1962978 RepID=UPI002CED0946|nr:outer membrane protein assembly factor BamB [Povalibacter sp.]HMN43195.1 outer membrane protein assembly factor BamB [Povalibacter sp.]
MIQALRDRQWTAFRWTRPLILLAALVGVAACDKDKDPDPPAELTDIVATYKVDQLWSVGLGGDSENLRLALRPLVAEGVVYAASHDGEVVALDATNGRNKWSVKTKLPLAAGPDVGAGLVILGSSDGDVIALDAATGQQRWRKAINSEVLARPAIVNDLVIVRTVDGHLEGLSLTDGATRWAVDEQVPRLTLRGTASPVVAGDRVIAGFDNGRVLAVDVRNGDVLWDAIVNAPHGRTELERLSDIDSPVHVSGDDIFVVGFQGRVAMLALDSGQIWWARDASSYRGFSMDDDNIYLTNSDGVIVAMKRNDGAVVWEQNRLRRRGLTAPTIDGDSLLVGDFEGYVHWLDKATGEIVARHKTDGERISNAATAADGRTFVQTDSGKLIAFKSTPKVVRSADAAE